MKRWRLDKNAVAMFPKNDGKWVKAIDAVAEIERLRSELLAAREDARRWQAFLRFTVGQADADLGPDIDITYTPSGYNGSQWATIELCWRHPQWTAATAEHANAAIDSAMKGDAS